MTDQRTVEPTPWSTEPELPPDPARVRAALEALETEAREHAAQAEADLDRLRTMLTAEPTSQAEHLAASRRLAAAQQTIEDVRGALRRLEEGTYGLCVRCGEAIPPARLEMRPASPYCVRCT